MQAVEEAMAKFSAMQPAGVAPSSATGLKEAEALLAAVEKSSLPAQAKYDVRSRTED